MFGDVYFLLLELDIFYVWINILIWIRYECMVDF